MRGSQEDGELLSFVLEVWVVALVFPLKGNCILTFGGTLMEGAWLILRML